MSWPENGGWKEVGDDRRWCSLVGMVLGWLMMRERRESKATDCTILSTYIGNKRERERVRPIFTPSSKSSASIK